MTASANEFATLLTELETLQKALPKEKTAEELAAEAKAQKDAEELAAAELAKAQAVLDGGKVKLKMADGSEVEVQDGTAMIKALQDHVAASEEVLTKALSAAVVLLKSQGAQIKALETRLEQVSGEGRGRKAIVTIQQPAAAAVPAKQDKISPQELIMKSRAAYKAERISSMEFQGLENMLQKGMQPSEDLVRRILA